jgi:hypothetical protein
MERGVYRETMPAREIQSKTYSTPRPIIPIRKGLKNRSQRHHSRRSQGLSRLGRRYLRWGRRSRTFRRPILSLGQGRILCRPPAALDIRFKRKSFW